jgi:lipopolysaccharide transport system permease protein
MINRKDQTGPADEIVIVPPSRWPMPRLNELAGSLDLLRFFVWRDVKVRYAQTLLGVGWAVLQPLATMVVFTIVFGRLLKVPSEGVPYPLFSLAGLAIWNLFSQGLNAASNSVVNNQNMVQKIYFARLILPLAAISVSLVDFVIAFVLVLAVALVSGSNIGPQVALVPIFALIAAAIALGVGSALGALTVRYRDVRHIVGFLVQLWLFATPVAYPASLVPERWQWLAGLNPMAGVVEGFRWSVLGTPSPAPALIITSGATATLLLLAGIVVFTKMEDEFADVI